MPDPSPTRKSNSAGWDTEHGAPSGETPDEKLRRLQMQMTSGSRTGASTAAGQATGAKPKRRLGEIIIIAFASTALAAGIVVASINVLKKTDQQPPARTATPEAPAVLPQTPDEVAKPYRWIKSDSSEAEPYTTLVNSFFAADSKLKKNYFEPTPQLDARLEQYSDNQLLLPLPPQRYAKNIFITDDGIVSIDTNISGHGFRPIVMLPAADGSLKIDFDSFIGHNDFEWETLLEVLAERGTMRIRALLKIDRQMTAKVPGDVILEFRNPSLENEYHAHLSILDVEEKHIVRWLNAGIPLPFTITLTQQDSLYGKILRVEKIDANAWLIDDRGRSLSIAP